MNDIILQILSSLGTLGGIVSVIIGYKEFMTKTKKEKEKENYTELKEEIEMVRKDTEMYRQRWIKAEQENSRLRNKLKKEQNDDD